MLLCGDLTTSNLMILACLCIVMWLSIVRIHAEHLIVVICNWGLHNIFGVSSILCDWSLWT